MLGNVEKITWAWTSGSAGEEITGTTTYPHTGEVLRCYCVPGTGDDTPSDQYDITVSDGDSIDVLLGYGANCSNASTAVIAFGGAVVGDTLTMSATNAGNSNKGTVILHLRKA